MFDTQSTRWGHGWIIALVLVAMALGCKATDAPVVSEAPPPAADEPPPAGEDPPPGVASPQPAGTCGDGAVDPGEECDDGNRTDTDACPDGRLGSCRHARCGDGVRRVDITDSRAPGYEACDAGTLNSATRPDGCRPDCRPARCGDGVADPSDECDLSVRHQSSYPTRLAEGPEGRVYVTDARVGAVFIYDEDLRLVGELAKLERPLGVAVDLAGTIYVGDEGTHRVEIFSAAGERLAPMGATVLSKPTDLAIARDGRAFVADSARAAVQVFDAERAWSARIGAVARATKLLEVPIAVALLDREGLAFEVFVADQQLGEILVFDEGGALLRRHGGKVEQADDWHGRFVRLQGLTLDNEGRIHALDCYPSRVQVLHPESGEFIEAYGAFGVGPGQLNLPLDIESTRRGRVLVANAENHRIEALR